MAPDSTDPVVGQNTRNGDRWRRGKQIILFGSVIAAANLFVLLYIRHEHTLYFWDNAIYWQDCQQMREAWRDDPLRLIATTLHTIRYYDYNYLPALMPSLCTLVVGNSRAAYLLLVTNLYALPAMFAFVYLIKTIVGFPAGWKVGWSAMVLAMVGLSNLFWAPLVIGYIDIGGLILNSLILALYFGKPLEKLSWRRLAGIGILLALLPLFRRWYGYWMIAFCITSFVDLSIDAITGANSKITRLKKWTGRLLAMGIPMVATIVLLSWPLPWRIIHEDLGFAYAAYRPPGGWAGSIWESFGDIWRYFGPFVCVALVAGLVAFGFEPQRRRLGVFMLGLIILATVLLSKVSELGPMRAKPSELGQGFHHLYVVFVPIMVVVCVLMCDLLNHRRPCLRAVGRAVAIVLLCLSALNFVHVFAWRDRLGHGSWTKALSQMRVPPSVRSDIAEMRHLALALGQVAPEPDDRIYVLAASPVINTDLLRKLALSLGQDFPVLQKVLTASDIDQRDGFPRGLMDADVLVVAWPIQHRKPTFQRTIGIPAQSVIDGTGFGSAFKRLALDFTLEQGVHAYIYRRARPLAEADLRDLSDRLKVFYPDHPEIYSPN
jgi:hypothetical protein